MGLTKNSVGLGAVDGGLFIKKRSESDLVVALAGNPNVGKSTVFNALTGMNQHTGNWPGKTVASAMGYCTTKEGDYVLVDIPGTYSLMAHSAEEEVARNFICFGFPDAVVVVCDATVLERNLNLVLQTLEISEKVIVCVNLLDEAKRKGIRIDLERLSRDLGVTVVGVVARKKHSLLELTAALDAVAKNGVCNRGRPIVEYPDEIEKAIAMVKPAVEKVTDKINSRWLSLRLLDADEGLNRELQKTFGNDLIRNAEINNAVRVAREYLKKCGLGGEKYKDKIVSTIVKKAEQTAKSAVTYEKAEYSARDRRLDKILTGKFTGYPVMLALLAVIFWITVTGANYPSAALSTLLFKGQELLTKLFYSLGSPDWLHGLLVLGVYRVLAWVVSVMLPPMAIFFPLFTLLEDLGYLPRVAYNLDRPFKSCNACGKQALTMCMGFGCNAAGIVGCRIIDSPRERFLAVLTNSLVPCNGRFPAIISIITMFFIGTAGGAFSSVLSALGVTAVIVLGVMATFLITYVLSKTILRGAPSSFALELPPYRRPQVGKVIIRSIFDRTLFVLGRAAAVAAPAGAVIWAFANINIGSHSLLQLTADFLDPFAGLMGLDGVILLAFILGFPANEIVIPIIIMAYMATDNIIELNDLTLLKQLFTDNGWTSVTAICTILFSLFHWPCSTTLITVKKETGSFKWAAIAAIVPTVLGMLMCMLVNAISFIFI